MFATFVGNRIHNLVIEFKGDELLSDVIRTFANSTNKYPNGFTLYYNNKEMDDINKSISDYNEGHDNYNFIIEVRSPDSWNDSIYGISLLSKESKQRPFGFRVLRKH